MAFLLILQTALLFFKRGVMYKETLPCVGDGLPADWRDELDGELLLLRINVTFICGATEEKQHLSTYLCGGGHIVVQC